MIIGHNKQWEFLKNKLETGQLSHAYLFTGQEGIGKKIFAKEFAEFVGCKFPDLTVVESDKGKEIPIAKIREIQNFLAYKSYNGGFKIVVVDNAELMNQEAQSCFLKTLEEPKGKTLLLLISSKPDMILPTIYSRCQQVKFFKPKNLPENEEKSGKEKEILKDLIPVLDSDFAEKFKYAKSIDFEQQKLGDILGVLQKYLRNILLQKITSEKTSGKYSISDLKRILNLIEDLNKKLLFTNANQKLALEILLMET